MSHAAEPTIEMLFELESLAKAVKYQRWVSEAIQTRWGRRILEVCAGLGTMSHWLPVRERLVLTETEPALLTILQERTPQYFGEDAARGSVLSLDLSQPAGAHQLQREAFDPIVSFNVLEHIEDDRAAIKQLLDILRATGSGVRRL